MRTLQRCDATMANIDDPELSFQQTENDNSEPPTDTTSFQFVPDKIIDFSISQVSIFTQIFHLHHHP